MSDNAALWFILFWVIGAVFIEGSPALALLLLVGGAIASASAWAWHMRKRN